MILNSDISSWQPKPQAVKQDELVSALEDGKVLYFPQLPFRLLNEEKALLTPSILDEKSKNISYIPKTNSIKGASLCHKTSQFQLASAASSYHYRALNGMMSRYANTAHQLLNSLIPSYQKQIRLGRTSYRPAEIKDRARSIRQDDTRLHIDAFPTTPTQGHRILRIFTNINPHNKARIWNLGEPFEAVVKQFKTQLTDPILGVRSLLYCLKLTKSYRSLYDHYMLQLHNKMKESDSYQNRVNKFEQHFPAGSTWIVMTDQVSHAALGGQYLLEQTFYLPVDAMLNTERSPLKILERHLQFPLL